MNLLIVLAVLYFLWSKNHVTATTSTTPSSLTLSATLTSGELPASTNNLAGVGTQVDTSHPTFAVVSDNANGSGQVPADMLVLPIVSGKFNSAPDYGPAAPRETQFAAPLGVMTPVYDPLISPAIVTHVDGLPVSGKRFDDIIDENVGGGGRMLSQY